MSTTLPEPSTPKPTGSFRLYVVVDPEDVALYGPTMAIVLGPFRQRGNQMTLTWTDWTRLTGLRQAAIEIALADLVVLGVLDFDGAQYRRVG